MLFKDLKSGYPVYIFDRSEIKMTQGRTLKVGMPYVDVYNPSEMVLDVEIENGCNTKTFTFKVNSDVGYANNLIISTFKEVVLRDIEVMRTQSEDELLKRERHEEIVSKCTAILNEHNPSFKDKKETEERFSKLEESVGELKVLIKTLSDNLKS